jgi:hypothetical protein
MNYIPEATQKHIDDLVKTINKLNRERNKLTAKNKAQAEQLILFGVSNSTSLKEMLVDFGNVVKNSEGQEVELLADAYIVYDRIKDEKEQ